MQGRLFIAGLVVFVSAAAGIGVAAAQNANNPDIVITWTASNSYTPPGYVGKVLPNSASQIAASLEIIANGRPLDLSNQTIYWYQNDNPLGGGAGAQKLVFRPRTTAPGTLSLKVELPDYPGGILIHEITIPIVAPVAVIEAPYPQGATNSNAPTVQALPYFFAATSTSPLSFSWSVNGQVVTSAENPQSLQISLPQSTPNAFALGISLTIENSLDGATASANTNLTFKK